MILRIDFAVKKMMFGLVYFFATVSTVIATFFEGTVYVNQGEQFTLPCKNETPGNYYGIIWKTTVELYAHLPRTGLKIDKKIYDRSRLVKETSLQIDNAKLDDAGTYECNLIYVPKRINFPYVVVPSLITVVVFARPNITSLDPVSQYQRIGRKAVIKCEFLGIPSANVTWKFDGEKDLTDKYKTVNNTSVLRLKRLKKKDTGFYTCVAYNRAGQREKRAYVKVMYPPTIKYITPNPHINVERTGTITCKANGYPLPVMFWYLQKDSSEISLGSGDKHKDKFSVSLTTTNRVEEWSESILTIKSLQVDDWRMSYTCIASNDEGSREKMVHVKGFDKPEPPKMEVTKITSTTAMLVWSVPKDGGSKLLAYVVQYKNTSEVHWLSREIRPANVQSFQITGLAPNTLYSFRISAKNEVGMSAFSKSMRSATRKEKDTGNKNNNGHGGTITPSNRGSQTKEDKSGFLGTMGITAIVGIVGGIFLILMVVFVIVYCLVKKKQKSFNSQQASVFGSRPVSIENGSLAPPESRRPSEMPSDHNEFIPLLARADHWEFPRARLRLSTVLGSGAFGMVMRGDAQGIRGSSGSVKVAVKIAKDNDNEFARKDLHAELDVLKLLPEHPNVVGLLGCCTHNEPLMIIVEYCAHGDLQGFLRSSRGISESYYKSTFHQIGQKLTSKMLLTFALQIAQGMSHLSAFKIIHRDLAARNILVDEDLMCKISDFGFARDVYIEDQYMKKSKGGRFPIKWMALESLLDGISTPKSDVWSFGVLLWEIVTLGASPYPGMNSYELVSFLQDGYRMDKPKHCSEELYALLMNCWHITPQRRPTFDELTDTLKQMLDETKEYINMNFYQHHLYENFDVNLACQSTANASGGAVEVNSHETSPLVVDDGSAIEQNSHETTSLNVAATGSGGASSL